MLKLDPAEQAASSEGRQGKVMALKMYGIPDDEIARRLDLAAGSVGVLAT